MTNNISIPNRNKNLNSRNNLYKVLALLLFIMVFNSLTTKADDITHNIATGTLIIPYNSTDNYIITGTTTTNYIVVEAGYKGVITLRNVNITLREYNSPIFIQGQDECSNLTPVTIVDIILEGNNVLRYAPFYEYSTAECVRYEKLWEEGYWTTKCTEYKDLWVEGYWTTKCAEYKDLWVEGYWTTKCAEYKDEWVEGNSYQRCVEYEKIMVDGKLTTGTNCVKYETVTEPGYSIKTCVKYENDTYIEGYWLKDYECVRYEDDEYIEGYWLKDYECVRYENDTWIEGYWYDKCVEYRDKWIGGRAAIHVDQGAQINISAINPSDNTSGTLTATTTGSGGAGIGASYIDYVPQATATDVAILGECSPSSVTAGGNIVISSGTVTATGGEHAAGIGGGWKTFYDGMIVIYGGVINASATLHAAGIGSGCPTREGVVDCYPPNGAVIVLPPATITAIGAGNEMEGLKSDLALAGAGNIIYIGDPEKPLNTVVTEDYEPYANIYVDLSESPKIANVINATVPAERFDINKVKFGQAGSDGIFQFHGILRDNTTFYTDATSSQKVTLGRPYMPKVVQSLPTDGNIILNLLETDLSVESIPSVSLALGYSSSEALTNAFRVKVTYLDILPMSNVVFDISGGSMSDFSTTDMTFYSSDGTTVIPVPKTLNTGDIFYVAIPLKTGKPVGSYSDVFRFIGTWNGISTGYIRQVVTQDVLLNISLIASPAEGGTVSGGGNFAPETDITVSATANEGYRFVNWTENGVEVSTDASYTFTVTKPRILAANFIKIYRVNVVVKNSDYGFVEGAGVYDTNTSVQVEAIVKDCYRFKNWTTITNVEVSKNPSYSFVITSDTTLVANFYALDFDYYTLLLWDNTIMLNLIKLRADACEIKPTEITGCKWFKNGVWEQDTRTIDQFSYSEGATITDKLEQNNSIYMFQIFTKDCGTLCSTGIPSISPVSHTKSNTTSTNEGISNPRSFDLQAYPNPLPQGSLLTIEGVTVGSMIYIYNEAGVLVKSSIDADSVVTLTLTVPAGVYIIRVGDNVFKIVIN